MGSGGSGWQAALGRLPEKVAEIIRAVTDAWAQSVGGGGGGSGGGANSGRRGAAGGGGAGGGGGTAAEGRGLGTDAEANLSLGSSFVQGVNDVGKV